MNYMENENLLPAIWAGMECTISRTHDDFHDQLACGGYYTNDYLDHVLQLNPKAVRFPILWERHEPVQGAAIDWTWARSQLNKLREQGVAPIVGLLHHGSGPAFTDLADPSFPGLLAEYAGRVAQAFPWVQYWSPVNEPLTTARFSGLYGHWYPHKKNDRDFLKMLINQAKAIVLSMAAIREISPEAKLIQTEDLAKTYSSPALRYQASFENNRRWLSLDLLCGKLTEKHPLYNYFIDNGISAADLRFFQDNPCAPAIIGANYYITSERYLATDLANYPVHTHGGNGQHAYADVEAIRVPIKQANGPRVLLQELWNRYQLPIALTEVHLHCSREEQLRWFKYLFDVAAELRNSGVDIQAVTAWAVLGSFGWDQLLTCKSMNYESGAFDISAGYCRITALGTFIKNLPLKSDAYEPLLAMPGWWQRPSRFFKYHNEPLLSNAADIRPLLILGKRGTLGRAFFHICNRRNIHQVSLSRQEADVCEDLSALLKFYKPWAVINATGYVDVDAAEDDPSACENLNTAAVVKLASACQRLNIPLVNF
ncbi:MAG: glycosyl hydrolase family protein [Chitinophagaceae bacterium]|nr:MAG: glycosyl hydrolase family protein [Chitinophagaceae bacterium]